MELRIAQITDADAIIAFDSIAASEPARVQFIHDQIESFACYVAVIDAKVVAYAVLNYKFYDRQWLDRNALCPSAILASRNRFCVNPSFNRRMPHTQTVHIDESIQLPDAATTGKAGIRSKWLHRKP